MNTAASWVDPGRCPLCGMVNACAMETQRQTGEKQPPCWCMGVRIPQTLRDRLPESAKNRACICAECARQHHASQTA